MKKENSMFLFVTDKYSSLNYARKTNKIVSNHKEWVNMCLNILLKIPDKNCPPLLLGSGPVIGPVVPVPGAVLRNHLFAFCAKKEKNSSSH